MAVAKSNIRKFVTLNKDTLIIYDELKKYPNQTFSQFVESLIIDYAASKNFDYKSLDKGES